MYFDRPGIARDPRRFGRSAPRVCALAAPQVSISDDLRLFATTFAAGFLFISVLIA